MRSGNLAQHSVAYAFGAGVAMLGGILLLPVYTHALSPAEYGLLETTLRFVNMCLVVAFVGLRQGYLRFFFDGTSDSWQKTLTSTTVLGALLIGACVLLPLFALASLFASPLVGQRFTLSDSLLLTLWLTLEAIYLVGLSSLQVRFQSGRYVAAQCVRAALLVLTNYFMLNILELGLTGALLGNLLVASASGLIASTLLLRWAGTSISVQVVRNLVRFGAPYIPTAIFAYIWANADRLSLLHFGFAASLGLLSLASKLGEMAVAILTAPLENIWMPYALSVHRQPDGPRKIGDLFMRYIAILIALGLLMSLAAPLAVRILAAEEYAPASDLVPVIVVGCIFFSAAILSDIGIVIAKQTRLKPLLAAATAAVAITLQLILTPWLGLTGAVIGTSLTAVCQYLIVHFVASRFFRFEVRPRILLLIVVGATASFIVGRLLQNALPSFAGSALSILVGLGIYLTVVNATRLITLEDVKQLALRFKHREAAEPLP